jgi:hypothetical protein
VILARNNTIGGLSNLRVPVAQVSQNLKGQISPVIFIDQKQLGRPAIRAAVCE